MSIERHPKGARDGLARRAVRSPWDDREVGTVPLAEPRDVEAALSVAARAADEERRNPAPKHRAVEILEHAAAIIAASQEEIARLVSDEAGKPIASARIEAARALDTFAAARDVARTIGGELLDLSNARASEDRLGLVRRCAIGAVVAITPFNFPFNLVAHKLAPAVAAGAPVILKPSPQAPLSGFALARILHEAGLPEDRLQVVFGDVSTITPLVEDPRPRMISFTGSARVGWAMRARCGEKKCVLELGGNAAVIVDEGADLARAAERIVAGGYGYGGQSCISVQRVFAHRSVFDELRARVLEGTSKVAVGDPARHDVVCGPVIDDPAVKRIGEVVAEAIAAGARASSPLAIEGRVVRPMVLEGVRPELRAAKDEIFAPVVLLDRCDSFDEAVERANDGRWGLQTGIFTRDLDRLMHAWERLEVGAVVHDDAPTFRADAMPYGGVKSSGLGREGPNAAFLDLTEPRLLLVRHRRSG